MQMLIRKGLLQSVKQQSFQLTEYWSYWVYFVNKEAVGIIKIWPHIGQSQTQQYSHERISWDSRAGTICVLTDQI